MSCFSSKILDLASLGLASGQTPLDHPGNSAPRLEVVTSREIVWWRKSASLSPTSRATAGGSRLFPGPSSMPLMQGQPLSSLGGSKCLGTADADKDSRNSEDPSGSEKGQGIDLNRTPRWAISRGRNSLRGSDSGILCKGSCRRGPGSMRALPTWNSGVAQTACLLGAD